MSDWDQIDDIFRDKLQHHSEEAPMHIWDRVEQTRLSQKKRGAGFLKWMFAIPVLFVASVLSATWVYFSVIQQPEAAIPHSTGHTASHSDQILSPEWVLAQQQLATSLHTLRSARNWANPSSEESAASLAGNNSSKVPPTQHFDVIFSPSHPNKQNSAVAVDLSATPVETPTLTFPPKKEALEKTTQPGLMLATPAAEQQNLPAAKEQEGWSSLNNIAPLNPAFDPLSLTKKRLPDQKCHDFKIKLGWRWFMEATGSSDWAIRSLVAKTPQNAYYAAERNKTEEAKFSFTTGLRLGALIGKGWTLRTGLQYAQINEDFNYHNSNEVRIVITEVYDTDGTIIGVDTTYESGQRTKLTHNRYRMVDVPVTMGYEFDLANFVLSVQGGAAINVWFSQKGEFLSPELDPVDFSSGAVDPFPAFRDKLGMSLIGSIGLHYRFHERARLIIEPHFRYFLQPFSDQDYMLKQEYFVSGLTTGIRFRL